jgi:EpsI family protein
VKTWLAAFALLALTAAAVVLTPPVDLAAGHGILRAVPQAFGPWQGTDSAFERAVVEELRADDLLIRRYRDGERSVWLCLVYHQNRRYGSHDPLLCYTSQGYDVADPGRARVDDGSPEGLLANTCIAERGDEQRVVWYWWTTQGLSTPEVTNLRDRMALLGALENRSWGTFVRVESVVREGDVDAASARVREFAGLVARELPAVFAQAAPPAGR